MNDFDFRHKKSEKLIQLNPIREENSGKNSSNRLQSPQKQKQASDSSSQAKNKLIIVCLTCFVFMGIEFVGGIWASSLAIMTDAAHLLSDLAGFVISILALQYAKQPPDSVFTYGFYRAEIVGAFLSVMIIWILTIILLCESIERMFDVHHEIDGKIMLITASIGLVFNLVMGDGHSHCGHHHHHDHSHDQHGHKHERRLNKHNTVCEGHKGNDHNGDCGHSHADHKHNHSQEPQNHRKLTPVKPKPEHCCHGHHEENITPKKDSKKEKQECHSHNSHQHNDKCDHDLTKKDNHHNSKGKNGSKSDEKQIFAHKISSANTIIEMNNHKHLNLPDDNIAYKNSKKNNTLKGIDALITSPANPQQMGSEKEIFRVTINQNLLNLRKKSSNSVLRQIIELETHDPHCQEDHHVCDAVNNHDSCQSGIRNKTGNNNVNVKAAMIHIIGDIIQSVGVIIASVLIYFFPAYHILDPLMTIFFSVIVMFTTIPIVKECIFTIMEAKPVEFDFDGLRNMVSKVPGVKEVKCLHVFCLSTDKTVIQLKVVGDQDDVLENVRETVLNEFDCFHLNVEVQKSFIEYVENQGK